MKKAFVIDSSGPPRPADKYDAPRFMADKGPVGFHVMIKPAGDVTIALEMRTPPATGRGGRRDVLD